MAVTFSAVGDAREMHPIVRDEIYRIGYEAIRNACTHSAASRLQVDLRYAQGLALRVSDNGTGIDPVVADRGKDGHFGLQGMRERAARIGGKLTLVSSSSSGTEVTLIVPGGMILGKMTPSQRSLVTRHSLLRTGDLKVQPGSGGIELGDQHVVDRSAVDVSGDEAFVDFCC